MSPPLWKLLILVARLPEIIPEVTARKASGRKISDRNAASDRSTASDRRTASAVTLPPRIASELLRAASDRRASALDRSTSSRRQSGLPCRASGRRASLTEQNVMIQFKLENIKCY